MIQVEYKLKIGADEFTIKAEAKNEKEFFETMSFYTSLPKTGPGGETDLKLVYRNVKGYTFYSLVSEKAQKEFQLGQYKEGDGLYAKGWETLYKKDGSDDEEEEGERTSKKSDSRFSKKAAPAAKAKQEASDDADTETAESDEDTDQQSDEREVAEAPVKKSAGSADAPKNTASRINNLLAKYGDKKSSGNNSNLKRE